MVKIIEDRDGSILKAAVRLAEEVGFQWITREAVAKAAGVAPGTVNNAFGTMPDLKRAVLREAVTAGILSIVAQGLAERHPIVMNAPEGIRRAAAAHMTV